MATTTDEHPEEAIKRAAGQKRKERGTWDVSPQSKRTGSEGNELNDNGRKLSTASHGRSPNPTLLTSSGPSGLTLEQRARLEKAKAFARDQTATLLQSKAAQTNLLPGLPNMLVAGIEARSIAVMSRIYVGSINFELGEPHIKAVFQQFGHVKSVSMTIDPSTSRHKGFCFVEYEVPEAAELALELMNGAQLGGRQLKVGRPNNYNSNVATNLPPPIPSRIYIANVNEYVSEENIESIFEAFGKIKGCSLLPDVLQRKHKTNGYIEFEDETSAIAAIAAMNNFELGGLPLRVRKAILGGALPNGMKSLESMSAPVAPAVPASVLNLAQKVNSTIAEKTGGILPRPPVLLTPTVTTALQNIQSRITEESAPLEEPLAISATQRYSIMQKLLREDTITSPVTKKSTASSSGVPSSSTTGTLPTTPPSTIIRLENMARVRDIDPSLNEEISEECSKFGRVLRVLLYVDPVKQNRPGGLVPDDEVEVYVQFADVESAKRAYEVMNRRFFAGRQILAGFFDELVFEGLEVNAK
ncbi:hypothetical protein BC832DRAFT_592866 [Gaertneriomyces semiglobifer]|nr:hypothetical protein BC832DRAFT_592866 [Gaertneriomyces semiglobifer]